MIVDIVTITARAGEGGDGCVSFHREKYVQAGGPDGGDGGRGGSVVMIADPNMRTLMDFRLKSKYAAPVGEKGATNNRTGKTGEDLVIRVPIGTVVKDAATEMVLADLGEPQKRVVLLHGGRGGWGNARFATPTRQAPNFAKPGQKTAPRTLVLELKSIADVGLAGYPNAGKSTLLSVLSAARPKIADYPFTTLSPNLGVVKAGDDGFVMADIPGLIEGASEGAGLGHEFLRHIERTRLILHVIDMSGQEGRDPLDDYDIINAELAGYADLAQRPQIVAANKMDLPESEENLARLRAHIGNASGNAGADVSGDAAGDVLIFPISAATSQGLQPLLRAIMTRLAELPPVRVFEADTLPEELPSLEFKVRRDNEDYVVEGPLLTRLVATVNFADSDSLKWFQRALRRYGIINALRGIGAGDGDTVRIGDLEFDFID